MSSLEAPLGWGFGASLVWAVWEIGARELLGSLTVINLLSLTNLNLLSAVFNRAGL